MCTIAPGDHREFEAELMGASSSTAVFNISLQGADGEEGEEKEDDDEDDASF